MTAQELERLPILLSRSQVISAGIPRRAIPELITAGELLCVRLKDKGKRKYLKSSVAKLVGL